MGDYLGDLTARSLNLADILQPRPVSLFEPTPAVGEARLWHVSDLNPEEGEPNASQLAVEASPTRPPPRRLPRALPWSPEPVVPRPLEGGLPPSVLPSAQVPTHPQPVPAVESPARSSVDRRPIGRAPGRTHTLNPGPSQPPMAAALPPQARTVPLLAPPGPPEARRASRPLAKSSPPPTTGDQGSDPRTKSVPREHPQLLEPIIRQAVIEETVSRTLTPAAAASVAPAGPEPVRSAAWEDGPARPAPGRSQLVPLPSPTVPARSQSEPLPSPTLPATATVQPRITPAPPLQPAAFTRAEPAPAPGPTVHVTIGRIEVRATPSLSALKPRRRPSAPPVMSLDEYLRQRANGGNR